MLSTVVLPLCSPSSKIGVKSSFVNVASLIHSPIALSHFYKHPPFANTPTLRTMAVFSGEGRGVIFPRFTRLSRFAIHNKRIFLNYIQAHLEDFKITRLCSCLRCYFPLHSSSLDAICVTAAVKRVKRSPAFAGDGDRADLTVRFHFPRGSFGAFETDA